MMQWTRNEFGHELLRLSSVKKSIDKMPIMSSIMVEALHGCSGGFFSASFLFGEDAFASEVLLSPHITSIFRFFFLIRTPVERPNTQQILRRKKKKKPPT